MYKDQMTKPTVEAARTGRARMEPPDISEKGGLKDGEPQRSDERMFMQLLAFGNCRDTAGCTRCKSSAARVTLPVSATVMKARSCFKSMRGRKVDAGM